MQHIDEQQRVGRNCTRRQIGHGNRGAIARGLQPAEQRIDALRRLVLRQQAHDDERHDPGDERGEEYVRVPVIQALARHGVQREVRRQRAQQARQRAPPVRAPPDDTAQDTDADKRRERFGQQERVEHALDQKQRIQHAEHRDDEAADAPDPQIVPVRPVRHQPPPIESFSEERAAVDQEGRARGHSRGQNRCDHQTERSRKQ